jgi:hypothetical protein
MTMVFTATVKKGAVVIRDVPLPDGEVVDVTIERQEDEFELTPEEERIFEEGEAAIARGETGRPLSEFLAELKAEDALRGVSTAVGRARGRTGKAKLGAARSRAKSAAGRARKSR